jgi:A/G-specific adenine glycosylase
MTPRLPSEQVSLPNPDWLQAFRRKLRAWYARNARQLPWRRNRDPYAIWISEIMLQQTQVATVRPYFERFLARFPTIAALAEAQEQDVLRLWEGLGYYRRARQLHQAAKAIVAEHGGLFPRDPQAARRLPGIGRYTAGAILSIAFDLRQPILEANTLRLFSRLLAYRGEPTSGEGQRLLWAVAETVLPQRETGTFNQALMELGSEVCQVRAPRCEDCPVALLCRARAQGLQATIPPPKRKPVAVDRHEVAVLVHRRGRVLLVRCPEGARWTGLWDFPRFAVNSEEEPTLRKELVTLVRQQTGVTIQLNRRLTTLKHGVTRFRITLDCYSASYVAQAASAQAVEMRWLKPEELAEYPLCTSGRKLSRLLEDIDKTTGKDAEAS